MKPLTEKQQKVLAFVKERLQDGIPPSVREICEATGIKSTSTVHGYITRMRRDGLIVAEDRCPRTIQIKRKHPQDFTNIRTNTIIRKSV